MGTSASLFGCHLLTPTKRLHDDGIMSDNQQYAFPAPPYIGDQGMTLRDYFAAAALTGITSRPFCMSDSYSDRAQSAYRYADAMLAQRNRK